MLPDRRMLKPHAQLNGAPAGLCICCAMPKPGSVFGGLRTAGLPYASQSYVAYRVPCAS
jgi:hypothetical protein